MPQEGRFAGRGGEIGGDIAKDRRRARAMQQRRQRPARAAGGVFDAVQTGGKSLLPLDRLGELGRGDHEVRHLPGLDAQIAGDRLVYRRRVGRRRTAAAEGRFDGGLDRIETGLDRRDARTV
jgi:hypothetical protein